METSRTRIEPEWLRIAREEMALGVEEISGVRNCARVLDYHSTTTLRATDDETPWCSAFVNWCLWKAGIRGTNSARARSWLEFGLRMPEPMPGAIAVLKRGSNPALGHVGFYIGEEPRRVFLLGGNQSNRVTIAAYEAKDILGYRWPRESDYEEKRREE